MSAMTVDERSTTNETFRWLNPAESRTWLVYLETTRRIAERMHRQLVADSAISAGEYDILARLSDAPERTLRMSELATRAVNSRSRLTHAVARMEADGLVLRTPCPADGRGVLCTLTDSGQARLAAAAPGHVTEVLQMMFNPLTPAEVDQFGDLMAKILQSLRHEDTHPEAPAVDHHDD